MNSHNFKLLGSLMQNREPRFLQYLKKSNKISEHNRQILMERKWNKHMKNSHKNGKTHQIPDIWIFETISYPSANLKLFIDQVNKYRAILLSFQNSLQQPTLVFSTKGVFIQNLEVSNNLLDNYQKPNTLQTTI